MIRSRLDLSRASVLGKAHGDWASKSSLDFYRYDVGAECHWAKTYPYPRGLEVGAPHIKAGGLRVGAPKPGGLKAQGVGPKPGELMKML